MSTEINIDTTDLDLQDITTLQIRSRIRPEVVTELKLAIEEGVLIDPALIIRDASSNPPRCWLADGHHRLEAYRLLGRPMMPCRIQTGTKWDAIRIGLEANGKHVGERMSRADKEHAVRVVLKERSALADGVVAELVGCDPKTVAKYRREMVAGKEILPCDAREGLDGKVYSVAPRRPVVVKNSPSPTAEVDATHPEADGSSRDKPFEPTPAGPRGSSSNGEIQKSDQLASSPFPAASSSNDESNSNQPMPGSDRGLPGHLVDASGSGRDGDDGGRVAKSQNLNDFEKNRLKAHEYLGRLWKCIDGMKTISPNAGMYQHFRTCGEKISQLLDTWPRSPEGITDATAPKGSQITNLDIDDF